MNLRVRADKCDTCIFRPGNLMSLSPGRVSGMVQRCLAEDAVIPCHEYLHLPHGDWTFGDEARGAVCRGFLDQHGDAILAVRLARLMSIVEEVK